MPLRLPPPRQHQKDAEAFLRRRGWKGALLMEPGLGKTRTVIELALVTMARVLVFAPKRACDLVWPEQLEQWAPGLRYAVITGEIPAAERARRFFDPSVDVAVVNYELAHWLYELVRERRRMPYDALALDESTRAKASGGVTFRSLKAMQHLFDAVVPMTGTPVPNSLYDLWAQLWMVDRGESLGKRIGVFQEAYCVERVYENYRQWVVVRPQELMDACAHLCFVRRAKDCLDMPPLTHVPIRVRLGAESRRLYDRARKEKVIRLPERPDDTALANAGVALQKCRQLSSGFFYWDDKDGGLRSTEVGTEKVDALEELVEERSGAPLLVSYEFDAEREMVLERIPDAVWFDRVDRGVLEQWRRGEIPVLLGQSRSISLAVNMQSPEAAVCFYSLPWSHEAHFQVIRRVWRQGQRTPVVAYDLRAIGTYDEYVSRVLTAKEATEDAFFDTVLAHEEKTR